MTEGMVWKKDRMLWNDLVFRLEHYRDENWELGDDCFVFYKIKPLFDQYEKFWSSKRNFNPKAIFELGIWDGGSVAFWNEYFHSEKHVAIDIKKRGDSEYFQHYIRSRGLEGRIKTYWGTSQTDETRLREIVKREFDGPLDLVMDDASHMYDQTKSSFEVLFPFLRPGGLYVIEDWAWAHWKEFQTLDHPWALETELTRLIFELVETTGSSLTNQKALISSLTVFQGFVVIERGELHLEEPASFKINKYISRRPQVFWLTRFIRGIISFLKILIQHISRMIYHTLRNIWRYSH
jgi:hypothetical protein